MKLLLLGAGGQVGRAVVKAHRGRAAELIVRGHAELDITDRAAVERCIAELAPDWVVNCAAFTAVDLAEQRPQEAFALNAQAVGTLAAAVALAGARLLHVSTDFVFDGLTTRAYRADDAPNPLSVYGASKLAGESQVLASGARGIVLRTAWVYAAAGRNFVLTMLKLMAERAEVRVVCDQIGAPTFAGGIGTAILDLIETAVPPGIYQWTDLGVASWYDFAVAIQEEALARDLFKRAIPVRPISTAEYVREYPRTARRPAFSVLDTAATRARITTPAVHWRGNLRIMLDELRAA